MQCQTSKRAQMKAKLVGKMPMPNYPFEQIGMDFMGPLHEDEHHMKYLLVIMDHFTRYAIAIPTRDQLAETVANCLLNEVIFKFGTPRTIITDRGSNFQSELMQAVYNELRIRKIATCGYHPQANGMVEKFNSTIKQQLKNACDMRHENWSTFVPSLVFAYNTTIHSVLNEKPYVLVYGRDAVTLGEETLEYTQNEYSGNTSEYLNELKERLNWCWSVIREKQNNAYNKYLESNKKLPVIKTYKIGDFVWIRLAKVITTDINRKFVHDWIGPFKVMKRISDLSFVVQNVKLSRVQPQTVHVSRMKPYYSPRTSERIRNLAMSTNNDNQMGDGEQALLPRADSVSS